MSAVEKRLADLPPEAQTVLVSGLSFPFSPFDHPWSLAQYRRSLPQFTVVAYSPKTPQRAWLPSPVRYASPEVAARGAYDAIWAFGDDGSATEFSLSETARSVLRDLRIETATLAVYPAVGAAFRREPGGAGEIDGYQLLHCGEAFMAYEQYENALTCFRASTAKIPENPYPYFYSGYAYEKLGRLAESKANFEQAVSHDDRAHPNPGFTDSVKRVSDLLSAAGR